MSINDKKGINLTSGFKYVGGQPLDVRLVAEDESDLQSLVDNGATYNGMVVWVNSTSKRMVFNGSEFIEDVNPNTIGNINDVLEQINGGGTFSGGGSSSGGSSEIITTNYIEGNDYLTTDNVLSEGLYKLNINIGTYYSFTSFLDISNASIAFSTTSFGKLGSNSNLIMAYTYENTNGIGAIEAYILMLTGSTTQAMRLSELWEFFKNNANVYPTITLTKIH